VPVSFKIPQKQEEPKYVMQIERESDLAELCLYADLVTAILFKEFKLRNPDIFNLCHNPLSFRQGFNNNRFVIMFAACNRKLILQVIILDSVADLQAGYILVVPKISNPVEGSQESEGGGNTVQDRLLQFLGETALYPEVQYEIIPGVGDDDISYLGILPPGYAGNQQKQTEYEYEHFFPHGGLK
jgi:hypothetical protein